ncbi:MAG TPA: SRPBCC family protein [Acidobacteriaceae bacterium]|nr:SRPBCC family protein [Acidobacteriaceae bacterium]
MRHKFHTEQWVPFPRGLVFAFFANPENLPALMPKWQCARIEKAVCVVPPIHAGAPVAGKDSVISISFRAIPRFPLRLAWDACITEFRWNDFFCDEQRRGPFRYFRHCHRIREEREGSVVCDAVEYELPAGPLGDLANLLVIKSQIRALFAYRQRMLPELLQSVASR